MIYPKGQAVYENLSTSFTNFGELLLDLKSNSLTGFVRVSFWEYEGILFLDSGNIVNGNEESGASRKTGQEAVKGITAKAVDKNGSISVYNLSEEMVTMLTSVTKSEVVYKDLTTDFTSLDRLIAKLQKEEHTGYVEVTMNDEEGVGIVFLQAGDPIESILSANGSVVSGPEILPRIIESSTALGAAFNVYRAVLEESFAESAAIMAGFGLPELLAVWQEISAALEKLSDSASTQGHFMDVFKDTLIEKADEYPFLDPFAAEFRYHDGQIEFDGGSVKDLSRGLGDCLVVTIGKLTLQSPNANLMARIKAEMAAIKAAHADTVKKFDLEVAMPDYLA